MTFLIDLQAAPTQTIEILATGPGVKNLGPALLTPDFVESAGMPPDIEGLLSLSENEVAALPAPDVVELFGLAVGAGFFGSAGDAHAGARSSTRYESGSSTRVWILEVNDTPPQAFRVLLALLEGMNTESVAVRTTSIVRAGEFDVRNSEWPGPPTACPFRVELDDPGALEEAGTLHVRVESHRALSEDEMASVDRCFEIWMNILLLGGYVDGPLGGGPPAGLEPGGWEDDRTWVQQFEVFQCVPEAVYPVLHFTTRLARDIPIAQLEISRLMRTSQASGSRLWS